MPELPDVTVYCERLVAITGGEPLVQVTMHSPFVLRTVDPPLAALVGLRVAGCERLGKRLVVRFGEDLFLVIHLMIAGRLRWRPLAKPLKGKLVLATLEFPHGRLHLTEAGSTRRASVHLVRGRAALADFDRGGLEPLEATRDAFAARLRAENHTLKRALTDPRLFSGIGNAYSDEILHRARLGPLVLSSRLTEDEVTNLFTATQAVLREFTARIRAEVGAGFPETVTAFRPDFAVHGRFGLPCPACGVPVQRIRYASNETNYCARCQTGGRLLADRAMSRLLKQDWPRSLDEVE
ncbi:MAG TPA: DNA-formamidopyrimidine glycosylase family protein [Gemmatimonadaceae bacterium]